MKAIEFVGQTSGKPMHGRKTVNVWLGHVREMVQSARGNNPELAHHVLADVQVSRGPDDCQVTLVFRQGHG